MSVTTVVVNSLAAVALGIAFFRDPERGKRALRIALRSFVGMLPMVLMIILLIGLLLGFVTPATIQRIIGEESGLLGILFSTAMGAVAAFITSLTMIGTLTLPLEIKELGLRFTLVRNGLGLLFAVLIALAIGAIL